jgi:hypothetical protein
MRESGEDRPADEFLLEEAVVRGLRSDAAQAILLLGELRCLTQWDDETLCAELGCDLKASAELDKQRRRTPDRMRHSIEFLELVRDAAQLVDLTEERREIVSMVYALCDGAGGAVSTRVKRGRAALEHTERGELSAFDLLALGELGRASRVAALAIGSGPVHERVLASERLAGAIVARGAHISADRLRVLASPGAEDLLGGGVAKAMGEHLTTVGCRRCASLAASLGLRELLRLRELQTTAA